MFENRRDLVGSGESSDERTDFFKAFERYWPTLRPYDSYRLSNRQRR